MTGILTGTESANNIFGLLCALTSQFLIWEAKIRKKVISINWINSEFTFIICSVLKISGKFRTDYNTFVRGNIQNWDHIYLPARG
jgi:glucan phosphoethanolaminetransferase (alkaline phosphatase superfamily)